MKTYRKESWFNLPTRVGFVNLTPDVAQGVMLERVEERFDITPSSLIGDTPMVDCRREEAAATYPGMG